MFHELQILAGVVIFGILHLMTTAQLNTKQRGLKWNLSARDGQAKELTGTAARMDRAFKNFLETFPFFVASVLLVHGLQKNAPVSQYGALLYFIARLAYVPLYAFAVAGARSIAWFISMAGILLILSALLV